MDKTVEYYAKRAQEYESVYDKPERQADLAALRARLAKACAGRAVLEIACGTGWWTQVVARGARGVTALDASDEMLEIARAKGDASGKVTYVRGDAYGIPDFGRRHDALLAGFWWSHVPLERLDAFLEAAGRAVAPGALMVFVDNRYVEGSSTPIARREAGGDTWQLRELADGSAHEVLKNFPSEGELIRRATRHGWGANVELYPYYWLLTYWSPS